MPPFKKAQILVLVVLERFIGVIMRNKTKRIQLIFAMLFSSYALHSQSIAEIRLGLRDWNSQFGTQLSLIQASQNNIKSYTVKQYVYNKNKDENLKKRNNQIYIYGSHGNLLYSKGHRENYIESYDNNCELKYDIKDRPLEYINRDEGKEIKYSYYDHGRSIDTFNFIEYFAKDPILGGETHKYEAIDYNNKRVSEYSYYYLSGYKIIESENIKRIIYFQRHQEANNIQIKDSALDTISIFTRYSKSGEPIYQKHGFTLHPEPTYRKKD